MDSICQAITAKTVRIDREDNNTNINNTQSCNDGDDNKTSRLRPRFCLYWLQWYCIEQGLKKCSLSCLDNLTFAV